MRHALPRLSIDTLTPTVATKKKLTKKEKELMKLCRFRDRLDQVGIDRQLQGNSENDISFLLIFFYFNIFQLNGHQTTFIVLSRFVIF